MARIKTLQDLERLVTANEQSARDMVASFAAALAQNPCSALRHDSHVAIAAAAQIQVCVDLKDAIDEEGNNSTPATALAGVRDYAERRLFSLASGLRSRSTNHVANAFDDAQVAYLATIVDQIGRWSER